MRTLLLVLALTFNGANAQAQVAPSAAEVAAYTALHAAAQQGKAAKITMLAAGGAAVNATDAHGRTPLHVATFARQRDAIRARPWRLSLPGAAYAGRYTHAVLGEVTIGVAADDAMALRWGQLQADATGYDKPDHVRAEFVPNSGNVLEFLIGDAKVEALMFDGLRFERIR